MKEWLINHTDEQGIRFHSTSFACYNSSIATTNINEYLVENGDNSAFAIDPYHSMTSLHIISMNIHAPADAIAALLDVDAEAVIRFDNQGQMSWTMKRLQC